MINLEYLNLNSLRAYPIKETVSRQDNLSSFTIPNDLIVDLELAVSYDPAIYGYISKISNLTDYIGIEISDNEDVLIGTFVITAATHTQFKKYYLVPSNDYIRATGVITVDSLTGIKNQPDGAYSFTLANAELEMRTFIPGQKGINRIKFINASGTSFYRTGDVTIIARSNIRFKAGAEDSIIIDVGDGLGLNTDCTPERTCIQTINGIPPDEDHNFTLDFSDCAQLTPIPANTGLLLEDTCCRPCVGCNDIEELTTRLMGAENLLLQLRDYYQSLNTLYQEFKTTVSYTCACPPE